MLNVKGLSRNDFAVFFSSWLTLVANLKIGLKVKKGADERERWLSITWGTSEWKSYRRWCKQLQEYLLNADPEK